MGKEKRKTIGELDDNTEQRRTNDYAYIPKHTTPSAHRDLGKPCICITSEVKLNTAFVP